MRTTYLSLVPLLLIGSMHGVAAAHAGSDAGLIRLVSGDGLDADAAATGNDRTGGMWAGATHRDDAPYGFYGRWQTGPRHWTTYAHRPVSRWYWR